MLCYAQTRSNLRANSRNPSSLATLTGGLPQPSRKKMDALARFVKINFHLFSFIFRHEKIAVCFSPFRADCALRSGGFVDLTFLFCPLSFFLGFSACAYRSGKLRAIRSEGHPGVLKGNVSQWRASVRRSLALLGELLGEETKGKGERANCQSVLYGRTKTRRQKELHGKRGKS